MKYGKMILAAVLTLALCLSLCACGGEKPVETTDNKTETQPPVTTAAPETTEAPVDDGKVTYTVTVVDENNNPIPGALVQLCKDTCFPAAADDNGVATFRVPEADYKVSFLSLPKGFTYSTEAQEFYFDAGSCEMTIILKAEA